MFKILEIFFNSVCGTVGPFRTISMISKLVWLCNVSSLLRQQPNHPTAPLLPNTLYSKLNNIIILFSTSFSFCSLSLEILSFISLAGDYCANFTCAV